MRRRIAFLLSTISGTFLLAIVFLGVAPGSKSRSANSEKDSTASNAVQLVQQGRQIFRFDTFGDQVFWGDTLKLH